MRIEFLFSEVANYLGERGDMDLLRQIFPQADFIDTPILAKPAFLDEKVDLVFLGPMSEKGQELALEKLLPYRDKLWEKIEAGQVFLTVGNGMELFGRYIETDEGERIPCLNYFPYYAKRQMLKRQAGLFLGDKAGLKIVGSKAQFTQIFPLDDGDFSRFCRVEKGMGLHKGSEGEGLHYKNLLGTHILGPFLVVNPVFTKQWLGGLFGDQNPVWPYYDLAMDAYHRRLLDLQNPKAHG